MTPEAIKQLAAALAKLPSLGPRQALRLAFHIASNESGTLGDISDALLKAKQLKSCSQCFLVTDGKEKFCSICSDPKRNQKLIAIIEKETDLITLERAKSFTGVYLVTGPLRSDGVLENGAKQRIAVLKKRLTTPAEEIIIAFSPTTYGDIQASVVAQELNGAAAKVTRLGRGIPTGGEIEFADEETLQSALKNRN